MCADDSDDDLVFFDGIALDHETVARLMSLAEVVCDDPKKIIASIIRDVLEDDARENAQSETVRPRTTQLH